MDGMTVLALTIPILGLVGGWLWSYCDTRKWKRH